MMEPGEGTWTEAPTVLRPSAPSGTVTPSASAGHHHGKGGGSVSLATERFVRPQGHIRVEGLDARGGEQPVQPCSRPDLTKLLGESRAGDSDGSYSCWPAASTPSARRRLHTHQPGHLGGTSAPTDAGYLVGMFVLTSQCDIRLARDCSWVVNCSDFTPKGRRPATPSRAAADIDNVRKEEGERGGSEEVVTTTLATAAPAHRRSEVRGTSRARQIVVRLPHSDGLVQKLLPLADGELSPPLQSCSCRE